MKSSLLAVLAVALIAALGALFLLGPDDRAPKGTADADAGAEATAAGSSLQAQAGESAATTRRSVVQAGGGAPGAAGAATRLDFEGPAAVVTARLVAGDGEAAAGAAAEVRRGSEQPPDWPDFQHAESADETPEWPAVAAGRDGVVRVEVPAGVALRVSFGGDYWREQTRGLQPLTAGEIADLGEIALTSATCLTGRIRDARGAPLAGAQVELRSADAGEFWEGHRLMETARTDADGVARFPGTPRGRVRIEAKAAKHADGLIEALEVGTAADQEFEIRLERGGSARGRVVDADRSPVAGAELYLVHRGQNDFWWGDYLPPFPDREPDAVAGPDGSFELHGVPAIPPDEPSRAVILARADEVGTGAAREVRAGADVTITIPRGVRASGVVVEGDGAPVAAAKVSLHQTTPWGWDEEKASAETDAEGRFILPRVPPGEYRLSANAAIGEAPSFPLDLQRDTEDLRLRLERDRLLRVRVLDDAGAPVAGARVEAHTPGAASGGQRMISVDLSGIIQHDEGGVSWNGSGTTDESGWATFRDPAAGEVVLNARAEGWATHRSRLTLSGGDQEEEVRMVRPGTLVVRVHDSAAQPVRGVTIRVHDDAGDFDAGGQATDHLGRAVWRDLAPGAWTVRHDADGGSADGRLLGEIMLAWDDGAKEPEAAPEPGEQVRIEAGGTLVHEILLEDLAIVTVLVTRGGLPAPDVAIRLEPKPDESADNFYSGWDSGEASGVRTDARGVASLTPVRAGEYLLIAKSGRNTPETKVELALHAGPQRREVALNGAEVRGRLRGPGGPLVGARVNLEPFVPDAEKEPGHSFGMVAMVGAGGGIAFEFGDSAGSSSASTDGDGEYVFQDVPAGQWVVKARARGVGPWTSLPISVQGDRTVRVPEHTMLPGAVLHGRDANWTGPRGDSEALSFDWGSSIRVETAEGRMIAMTQPDDRGEWRVEDLAEGDYVVIRGSWRSDPIHLSPGEVQRADVPKEQPAPPER